MSLPANPSFKFSTGRSVKLDRIEDSIAEVLLIGNAERGPTREAKIYETSEELMKAFAAGGSSGT